MTYDRPILLFNLDLLMAKGGSGSGNFGHSGRPGRVGGSASAEASSQITTEAEARAYWQKHFAGKRIPIKIAFGSRVIRSAVEFDADNDHAFSVGSRDDSGRKDSGRTFSVERAKRMDRILSVIRAPDRVLDHAGSDLFIEKRIGDTHYLISLRWRERRDCYEFQSAYPVTVAYVADIRRRGARPARPSGTLQKSETPPCGAGLQDQPFQVFDSSETGQSGASQRPPGRTTRVGSSADLDIGEAAEFFKAIPPGARWITVRPNGPGTEGQPVLIQPSGDGAYRVVGGAGGKLNYLKLTGVKSEAEYAEHLKSKAAGRREEKKRQRERDKADGLLEGKKAAREALTAQMQQHQAAFVSTVANALGWKPEEMRFPEEKYQNVSEAARAKAAKEHAAALMKRASEAVDQQRQRLLQDSEARAAAGLGEVKLTSTKPDEISVQDLDPVEPTTKGFGYSTDYAKRAEEHGLTPEALAAEVEATKPPPSSDGKPAPAEKRAATAKKIADELKDIRDPGPQVDPRKVVEAKQAVELLKAAKALKQAQASARQKGEQINAAREPVDPKAYVIEVGAPADPDVVKDLENDLRTLKTRAFLEGVGKIAGNPDSLGRHIGVGGYNSINAVALAAGGASLVDRSVVDVLGVAGAAQVLARRLHSDLTSEEMGTLREAMERFHVDHYMGLSDSALRQAREWHEAAHQLEIEPAATGSELAAAQELNATRREFVQKAQTVLGTALGEMEANAAMVLALAQPTKAQVQASLGSTSVQDAIRQARAIGLDRGDYRIEKAGANTVLTVFGTGLDKLAQPVAKADLQAVRDSLDIIEGRKDEDDWLPDGVARRPEMAMTVKPGTAQRLAKPFPANPADVGQALRDFIGGRIADGDSAADVMAAVLSEDTLQKAGDRQAFMKALNEVAPIYDADGKMIRAEAHQAAFEKMADDFVERTYGRDRTPLHRQQFPVDQVSVNALHQALAEQPDGVAAFKPVGELTPQDQGALRAAFSREYGRIDPAADQLRADLEAHEKAEPEKEVDDMFGRGVNPLWQDWKTKRDDLAEKVNAATMTWGKYLGVMGSPANAYAAMQGVVQSKVLKAFADHHNQLRPDAPLKLGKAVIAHDLDHLDALDPDARERRLADRRNLIDSLRSRVAGRYASGSVSEKLEGARAAEEAANQAQMGLFGEELPAADPADTDAAPQAKPVELGERYTIGQAAERQIAGMMPIVGKNFRPGQPIKLWQPTMSGQYVGRQRAVKLIAQNKRVALGLGVGSGKTSISLAAFTHQHAAGQVKRGLFLVPSVVQGQFHGEALTVLEPGKYNWHCNPGADRQERIAAYKNPSYNFNVVTHQAFRDDMLHLAAERDGMKPEEVAARLDGMKPAERAAWMKTLLEDSGIDHDYLTVDEGHNLLNRAGKQNSSMANVVDAVSANMKSYVNMTADSVKNDPSEAFDIMSKMDPARYTDRDAFMRKYGVNTPAAKDGLRREMARCFYTGKIDPGVAANRSEVKVTLTKDQHQKIAALDKAAADARLARMRGAVDVQAMRTLSPHSFDGVDPAQHEEVAKRLQASVGIMHNAAVHHELNGGAKVEAVATEAAKRAGKPGVVFAHSLDHVHAIAERLKQAGRRPIVMTGANSSQEKDRIKRAFAKGEADVLVASDAGAVGANLQTGKWLVQADTPMTAMAQPLDANVLTPTGWRLMGDLGVGDAIMSPRGEIARVTGVFPQGAKDVYRIKFSDGSSTRCCMDHLWLTKSRDDVSKKRDWRVRTLAHLSRTLRCAEGEGRTRAVYHIPLVGRIDFSDSHLPIPPYLLGAILGDGEFGLKHISLACVDEPLFARCKADIESIGGRISKVGDIDYRLIGDGSMSGYPAKRPSPALEAARALGIVGGCGREKYIPSRYLFGRFDDRLALLQGLMDTDGTVDKRNGYVSFCNTSPFLISGVVHLAQSLGGVASVGPGKPSFYKGKMGKTHWKVSLSLPIGVNPFSLPRKAVIVDGRSKRNKMRRGIVSIEFEGVMLAQCIMVDHPDHLYVTDDFIVTHNTHAQRQGRIHRVGQTDDVDLIDLVADHPAERHARKRLADKYELRDIMSSPLEGLDDTGIAGYLKRIKAGTQEAAQPTVRMAEPHEVPEGLVEPDEQQSLF